MRRYERRVILTWVAYEFSVLHGAFCVHSASVDVPGDYNGNFQYCFQILSESTGLKGTSLRNGAIAFVPTLSLLLT